MFGPLGQPLHRLDERQVLELLQEGEDVAALAAAEAVVVPAAGLTWNDGVFSSWNGHSPLRLPPPALRSATYSPTTCSMRLASRTRSRSASDIRPATVASV